MDNSIGDILNGEPIDETPIEVVEEVVEQIPEETEQETADRLRDEKGRFAKKEETGVEPQGDPVPPTTDRLPQAEYAALKDERTKRQELQQKLQEYEQYFAQIQQQQQPQQAPEVPDMFADPEAFQAYVVEEAVKRARQELQPSIQQGQTMTRAEVSELLARQKFEDYDATIEEFKEALTANPFLLSQIQQAADPATFAYNAGKQWQASKSFGGAQPSEADIEARLREKIIAELNLNRPKAPSTFAGDRSVGARSGPAWSGPTPLGDMLNS
jgi:hypothetical protein